MIGQTVAHYKIIDQLGSGGMSAVYKALDLRLGRSVALKFLPREMTQNPTARTRFGREATAASALDHTAICTIYDIGETESGMMFIAMAYYDGETVSQKLRRSPLPLGQAARIAAQVAAGLHLAHEHDPSIIHRDIKPANIIVTKDGQAKILDFGVAKLAGASRITQEGSVVGTAYYMSPEQTSGLKLDRRSDIWSLGVVFYQMISGLLPFAGDNPVSVQRAILFEAPDPIDFLDEPQKSVVNTILRRALAKEPSDRYQSMREMAQDLEALVAAVPQAPPAEAPADDREHDLVAETSVAVLPFLDQSPDHGGAMLCQGIADELIVRLTGMQRLQVASFTGSPTPEALTDVRRIGEQLGVEAVLEGRILRADQRLRVTARLLQIDDGRYLWSQRYDRKVEDILEVQDEIAREIALAAHRHLIGRPQSSHSGLVGEKFDAHLLYLKGRYQWQKRTSEGLRKSIEYFEQSIAKEPQLALAYGGLADAYLMLGIYGYQTPEDVMPRAKTAAEQALLADDSLAEVYASRGCVRAVYDWDFDGAAVDFERAEHLDPSYATTYQWRAMHYLVPQGRFEEAEEQLRQAWELDPLSLAIATSRGLFFYYRRQYQRSIDEFHKALELDERFEPAHVFLGQVYDKQGRYAEALAELGHAVQLSGGRPDITVALGHAHAQLGHRDLARNLLEKLLDESEARYVSPSILAQVYTALDEIDMALTALERGCRVRTSDLIWIGVNPVFDALRNEDRFRALLEQIGIQDQIPTRAS